MWHGFKWSFRTTTETSSPNRQRGKVCPSAHGLRAAAQERLRAAEKGARDERGKDRPFKSVEDLEEFFRKIDARNEAEGMGPEPDWEEHKRVITTLRKSVLDAL